MGGEMSRVARRLVGAGLVVGLAISPAGIARADNDLVGGIGDIIGGVLALPMGILSGTFSGPPIIGTVSGAAFGAVQAVSSTARGLLRLVGCAVPAAASLAPYALPFLL